jgi:sec-independent protein translocase protein TatA
MIGTTELIILCVAGLLLFGNRLPDLARMLGKTVGEFKQEAAAITSEVRGVNKPNA